MKCGKTDCEREDTHPISVLGRPIADERVWITLRLCPDHKNLPPGDYTYAEVEVGREIPRRRSK